MKAFSFYVLVFTPLPLIMLSNRSMSSGIFFTVLFLYIFVYHPTLVALRLLDKQVITKADFAKTYIPFWNNRYFSEAFF